MSCSLKPLRAILSVTAVTYECASPCGFTPENPGGPQGSARPVGSSASLKPASSIAKRQFNVVPGTRVGSRTCNEPLRATSIVCEPWLRSAFLSLAMFSRFSRPGIASTYLGTAPCQFLSDFFFARRLMFSEQSLDGLVYFTKT